jgi:hypothetical protein
MCLQVGMIPEKVDATINKKREREARLEVERQVLPNRSPNSEQGQNIRIYHLFHYNHCHS